MNFVVIGISYKNTPQDLRESAALIKREVLETLSAFKESGAIAKALILSTCNRTEVYYIYRDKDKAEKIVRDFFHDRNPELSNFLYQFEDEEAMRHLFEVTSGIDSMVLFEDQILGQVKTASQLSSKLGMTGKHLNEYTKRAVAFSKRIRKNYRLSEVPSSLSATAVKHLKSILPDYKKAKVLVIGSGKMGRLSITHLKAEGFGEVLITSRSYHPGDEIEREVDQAHPYANRYALLREVDAVISATSSNHLILRDEMTPETGELVLIDLALPRDIDRKLGKRKEISLYTIDDYKERIDEGTALKESYILPLKQEIDEEVQDLVLWSKRTALDSIVAEINRLEKEAITELTETLGLEKKQNKLIKKSFNDLVRPLILKIKNLEPEHIDLIRKAYEVLKKTEYERKV